jgi:hypothetical protein
MYQIQKLCNFINSAKVVFLSICKVLVRKGRSSEAPLHCNLKTPCSHNIVNQVFSSGEDSPSNNALINASLMRVISERVDKCLFIMAPLLFITKPCHLHSQHKSHKLPEQLMR